LIDLFIVIDAFARQQRPNCEFIYNGILFAAR